MLGDALTILITHAEEIDWSNFTFQHGFRQPRPKLFELVPITGSEQEAAEVKDGAPDVAGSDNPVKMEVDGAPHEAVTKEEVGCPAITGTVFQNTVGWEDGF